MTQLLDSLLANVPVLLDGAWGTELHSRGLSPGESPDAWNLTHPDDVAAVARAYTEAGSAIVLTNTFGANRITLARYGLASRCREINQRGVELSGEGSAGKASVFASMGPTGALTLSGDVTYDSLLEVYGEQAEALVSAGAAALVIETMSDLTEARAAVAAARATAVPVVACMSFDSGREGDRTMMGVTPEEAARELSAAGAHVIGANCGQGIEGYFHLCERLRHATPLPIWIKPNAGLPELVDGKTRYRETPSAFASCVPRLLSAGASFIGGCCGTTPATVNAVRLALQSR